MITNIKDNAKSTVEFMLKCGFGDVIIPEPAYVSDDPEYVEAFWDVLQKRGIHIQFADGSHPSPQRKKSGQAHDQVERWIDEILKA